MGPACRARRREPRRSVAESVARAIDGEPAAHDVGLVVVAGGVASAYPAIVDLMAAALPHRAVEPSAAPPARQVGRAVGIALACGTVHARPSGRERWHSGDGGRATVKAWLGSVTREQLERVVAIAVASLLVISIASVGQVQAEIDKDKKHEVAARVAAGRHRGDVADRRRSHLDNGRRPRRRPAAVGGSSTTGRNSCGHHGCRAGRGARLRPRDAGRHRQDRQGRHQLQRRRAAATPARSTPCSARPSPARRRTRSTRSRSTSTRPAASGAGRCRSTWSTTAAAGVPEKELAAARTMAEDNKDFISIPGLYTVADYLVSQKVPVFGGRDDPASIAKISPNGIMLTEPLDRPSRRGPVSASTTSTARNHKPCLVHPSSDESGDWNAYESRAEEPHARGRPRVRRHPRVPERLVDGPDASEHRGEPAAKQGLRSGVAAVGQPDRVGVLHPGRGAEPLVPDVDLHVVQRAGRHRPGRQPHGAGRVGQRGGALGARAEGQPSG